MKNVLFLSTIFVCLFLTSCKNDNSSKKDTNTIVHTQIKDQTFSIIQDSTKVSWTAYKTTDKKPVGGIFKTIKLKNVHSGKSIVEMLNGTSFAVPVESIFSKNDKRDKKLKDSFFGKMMSTAYIMGEIKANSMTNVYANLTMNGITAKLPLAIHQTQNDIKINAKMDLKNWETQVALAALNVACGELHKGADGVSKTWDEVNIEINGKLDIK